MTLTDEAIQNIFVVGSGAMGTGIAQISAQAGYRVTLMDIDEDRLAKALETIQWSLDKLAEKDRLDEPKEVISSRVTTTTDLQEARDADVVIEAIIEELAPKQTLFEQFESICNIRTILATNTSTLPITEIAAHVHSPERVIGIHFFNPVHRMKLVEIIRGIATSNDTVSLAQDFVKSLGKDPVLVNRDSAGFIVNRINGMTFLEALRLYEKGVASVEDIDKAIRLGLGHPMGPFELMDMIGLDIVLNARLGIYQETRDPNHFPPEVLRRLVKAGRLGRKTKRGFYDYS